MNTIRICPVCCNPLPADAPGGLCPVCLLKTDPSANPTDKNTSSEPASTLTISPEAFMHVRYFGDYELQREIARGGMGVVWKARQSSLNRTVALKMILAGKLAGEAEVQRFRREAEAAANLQHPNIVAIHEVGQHDGQHYYSMDYVEGRDLGALVRESGPLPPARAAECLQTIAEAVHFAHQRGTLHRDLKPQNVLVDSIGVPRITDFGLAKFVERDDSLTQTGASMGSPSYMPPEQAAGRLDQIGPQSDVYSLGAILYELLTGRPPFRADTPMATMRQVMESEPATPRKLNPAVPPDLETICMKCLEKNPARRYPSARALAEELARFLKHDPIQAIRATAIRKAESWVRQHPWTLMAAVSLVTMVLTGLLYWQYERVRFLQSGPLAATQALHNPGWRKQELKKWTDIMPLVFLFIQGAQLVFKRCALGKNYWKHLFKPTKEWETSKPVSQNLRIVCGLIGLAGLGLTSFYFVRIIQASVWENSHSPLPWCWVYSNSTLSLMLLFWVARDYQRFVHGVPSRTLSAEQSESIRQAIFDHDLLGAIKAYRRAVPDVSRDEAREIVGRLTADLQEKEPQNFAPPLKLWDLNWRAMMLCLMFEIVLFFSFYSTLIFDKDRAVKLSAFGAGFLFGVCLGFLKRIKGFRNRFLVMLASILLGILAAPGFYHYDSYFFGLPIGALLIASGFTHKPRKPAPGKQVLTDVASPH